MNNKFCHYTVMLKEAIDWLNCQDGKIYIDATAGGGGHSYEISKKIGPTGRLIATDMDIEAINAARQKTQEFSDIIEIIQASYTDIPEILYKRDIDKITGGILFDLGASYYQLTSAQRGFSFSKNAPLDMRFNPNDPFSAYDVINTYKEEELANIFKLYGEERFSKRIAGKITEQRKKEPIKTTLQLANLIKSNTPFAKGKIHPATRVFQAIRIEVNNELKNIEKAIKHIIPLLEKDARIVIISFHSLEDRLVKNLFKYYASSCNCPPEQLVCKCDIKQLEILTKKPVIASEEEIKLNPPSRSAKLRAAKKV